MSMILDHLSARQGTITSKVYVQHSYDKEQRATLETSEERLEEIVRVPNAASSDGAAN